MNGRMKGEVSRRLNDGTKVMEGLGACREKNCLLLAKLNVRRGVELFDMKGLKSSRSECH